MNFKNIKSYIGLFPVMIIIIFVLLAGIFGAFLQSLGFFPIIGMNEISLEYYTKAITDQEFISSLSFTLYTTLVSSSISVIIGIIIAKILIELNIKSDFVFKFPIIIPHIIVVLFTIVFLSDTGIFSRILYFFGINNAEKIFSNILFDKNGLGIIFAYIWKESPYVILSVFAILKRISGKHEIMAINLGASKIYAFLKVSLPMLLPTIISTFTIIFAFSFGSYEIPLLLGATFPKALPVQAFIEYQNPMLTNRPYAMAINIIIIIFSIFFIGIFNFLVKRLVLGGGRYDEVDK